MASCRRPPFGVSTAVGDRGCDRRGEQSRPRSGRRPGLATHRRCMHGPILEVGLDLRAAARRHRPIGREPVGAVESAEELAVLNINGAPTRFVRFTLRRPKTDPFWFDLLAFTLDRLGERLATDECSCGCQGHGGDTTLPPNALAMAEPKKSSQECVIGHIVRSRSLRLASEDPPPSVALATRIRTIETHSQRAVGRDRPPARLTPPRLAS